MIKTLPNALISVKTRAINMKNFLPFLLILIMTGCATTPQANLSPVSSYGAMSCPQLQTEYLTLLEHEKYLEAAQSENNIFAALNTIGGLAMGIGSILLDDGTQPTASTEAASTSMFEDANLNNAKADSYKAKKDEMTKRKDKMTELMSVLECAIPSPPQQ